MFVACEGKNSLNKTTWKALNPEDISDGGSVTLSFEKSTFEMTVDMGIASSTVSGTYEYTPPTVTLNPLKLGSIDIPAEERAYMTMTGTVDGNNLKLNTIAGEITEELIWVKQ